MKRLLIACACVLALALDAAAQTVVQRWSAVGTANDHTIAVSGVTAGNLLVVGAVQLSTSSPTVTDDGSGTAWTCGAAVSEAGGSNITVKFCWKIAEGTPTTITLTSAGTVQTTGHAWELSGHVADVNTVSDGQVSGTSNGVSANSQNVSSNLSPTTDVLLLGVVSSSNSATFNSDPAGYTMLTDTTVSTAGDRAGSSGNSYSFATGTAANEFYVTVLAAFKGTGGGGGGSSPCVIGGGIICGGAQ